MPKTLVDIDDEALAAAEFFGTKTKRDTINAALRDAIAQQRRRCALDELTRAVANGALDLELLRDKKNYR